jgi:hypothetical protein
MIASKNLLSVAGKNRKVEKKFKMEKFLRCKNPILLAIVAARGLHHGDEKIERIRYGPFLYGVSSRISVIVLELLRRHGPVREPNADAADGIGVFVRLWAGDAGDGHREIGGRARQSAFRHRRRHCARHRSLLGQQPRRHAKRPGLVLFGIGDKAAVEMVRRAGRLGKQSREFAGRTGFGGDERQVLRICKLQGAAGQCGKIASSVHPPERQHVPEANQSDRRLWRRRANTLPASEFRLRCGR